MVERESPHSPLGSEMRGALKNMGASGLTSHFV